jgi:pimeloyl-ACP methyl ester carboxylesterase
MTCQLRHRLPAPSPRGRSSFTRRTRRMRTVALAAGLGAPSCAFSTSWAHATIGIRQSRTRLRQDEKSFCSTTPGSDGPPAKWPDTVQGMATHALTFLDGLGVTTCDVLGFSLGGMIAQQIAQDRPSMLRKMILVATAPRGGEDIMHVEKPTLAKPLSASTLREYAVLQKIFFAPTKSSQAAGRAFIERLAQRKEDLEPASGPDVARAQMASFREWDQFEGTRFADLKKHPSAGARRERRSRRNDSRVEFVLAGRAASERGTPHVSRLWPWFLVPVSRVLHAPGGRVSRVGLSVCALLSRQGDCHDPDKREPPYVDHRQRAPRVSG